MASLTKYTSHTSSTPSSSGLDLMDGSHNGAERGVQQRCVTLPEACPLSPTLFGIFLNGLHEHMGAVAPESGLLLASGRRVPFLCYADAVVLLLLPRAYST